MIKQLLFLILLSPTLSAQTQCPNLLQNPGAEKGITGWNFSTEYGTQYDVDWSTFGKQAFVASFLWSTKSQEIDLTKSYSTNYLDSEPEIYVQEMYKGHLPNCDDQYYFYVELRDSLRNVLDSFEAGSESNPIITSPTWQTSSNTFSSYGSGLRYIYLESGGKDVEFYEGNFGTDMDQAEIRFAADDNSECQTVNNLSIFENNKTLLTEIYPNPSSGLVTIDLRKNYEDITITLKSISGQVISEQLYESAKSINLEIDEASGLYFIETKIGSNKSASLMKIVKQ